ncbi:methyl-accepting chemotaxis protein [Pseudomonas triticifolii]|uniref:Methyl-accepting chemotaxis protein n=1 Tax=Pseudomonas triticifolii TaxID=2762592 RepID=A0ABR7BHB3_9PSED|nr:methyl-accepting chemotaxis protein [Pseudomonas triticifolii]MBC3956574.1 methyl-accepting chemotaxis protein [Pseudomonas triticifolii]
MRHLTFNQKIVLIAALVIMAVFCAFSVLNDTRLREDSTQKIEQNTRALSASMAHDIQSWLDGRLILVKAVAEFIAQDPSPENILARLQGQVLMEQFIAAYTGTRDGSFQIYPPREMPAGYDARQRQWYKDAIDKGAAMTEPYVGAGIDYRIITQAVPIRSGNQMLGVLGASLSIETISRTLNAQAFEGGGYAFMVSREGKILVHPDSALIGKTLSDLFPGQTIELSDRLVEATSVAGGTFTLFSPIKGLPSQNWYVGIVLDKQAALASVSAFRTSAIISTLVAGVVTLLLLGLAIRILMKPLRLIGHAMEDIAQGDGDLTRRLSILSGDEFGQLAVSFNRFGDRIHASIVEVSQTTHALGEATRRVLSASNSSVEKSEHQSGYTTSVATAIEELGATAQEIASSASAASKGASGARLQIDTTCGLVDSTISAMNRLQENIELTRSQIVDLNTRTSNIGRVLEVISTISGQTNLLALNAAIEAARAGEAGRGFAVVADEVRSLAHHTQEATEEIRVVIEALQAGATQAAQTMMHSHEIGSKSVQVAAQAGASLLTVVSRISEIDDMCLTVAAATEEQTTAVDQLTRDVHEISQLNRHTTDNLGATLRACAELDSEAERLHRVVGTFKV